MNYKVVNRKREREKDDEEDYRMRNDGEVVEEQRGAWWCKNMVYWKLRVWDTGTFVGKDGCGGAGCKMKGEQGLCGLMSELEKRVMNRVRNK